VSKEIIHLTNKQHLESIKASGFIELEGFNIENEYLSNPDSPFMDGMTIGSYWEATLKQMKHTGRYVWFTEDEECKCISQTLDFEKVSITFKAEDINAELWLDVAERLMFKSNKAKKFIRLLNNNAIKNGDDISKWWVCRERIDIKLGKIDV
jgi:hypothetical protein